MNNSLSEKLSAVWTLATGRPLPFLPEPGRVPEDFPVFFPLIGFALGLAFSLIAWLLVWLFGAFAGAKLAGILIAFLLEKHVSLIGIDFAGIRRPPEHGKNDQLCGKHGILIVFRRQHTCRCSCRHGGEKHTYA